MTEDPADEPLVTYLIGRLDRAVSARVSEVLAPFELTVAQFTTLSVLGRRPGLSNAQLARRALVAPQSMIQVVAALERRLLIVRQADPAHQRVLRTYLTNAGHRLHEHAERGVSEIDSELQRDPESTEALEAIRRWTTWLEERDGSEVATRRRQLAQGEESP